MSLRVWLPLNGNLNNQGLSNIVATNYGATINTSGKIGQCYSFDGSDDYIKLEGAELTRIFQGGNQPFSVCMWIYNEETSANRAILFGNYTVSPSTSSAFFNIELMSSSNQIRYDYKANPDWNAGVKTVIPTGTWTHICCSYDGVKEYVYINGVLQATRNGALPSMGIASGVVYYLGRDARTGATAFLGKMNDFRIYDHALSAKEVEEISKGLVLHYKLDNNGQGQYNLLKDTNKGNYRWLAPSGNGTGTVTSILIDGINCVRYEMTVKSTNWCVFAFRPTNNTEVMNTLHEINSYTLSFDIFPSQPINNAIPRYVDGNAQNNLINWPSFSAPANTWYHYEGTAVSSGATQSNQSFYINYLFDIGTYDFKNLKIEIGTKATGYNVHIEESFLSNIIYDSSGYERNGTIIGTLTTSDNSPRYNVCAYFNGSSDIRSDKGSFGWFDFKEGTVAAWYNPANTTQTWASVGIQNDAGAGSRSFSICNYSGKAATVVGYDSSWGNSSSSFSMAANTWYHLCATITNGDTVKLYVNGELVQTRTVTNSTGTIASTTQFAVGVDLPGSDERFTGYLSDVRCYSTALTVEQIKELYDTSATIDKNGNMYTREVQEI